jgi:murein DD-endopeptidase MepM/ murein hydrolase activator NlpD
MATNNPSNSNSNGLMRGPGTEGPQTGITGYINQQNIKQNYVNSTLSDNGYIKQSIDSLTQMENKFDSIFKKQNKLTAAQQKMKDEIIETRKRQQNMLDSQEASQENIIASLKKEHSLKVKYLQAEMAAQQKELEANKELLALNNNTLSRLNVRTEQYKKLSKETEKLIKNETILKGKMSEIASELNDEEDSFTEIENTAGRVSKYTKTLGEGIQETAGKMTNTFDEMSKVFNLQSIAQNDFLKKAQEKYDTINSINLTLGYNVNQSNSTYNSLLSSFNDFNQNIGGLYTADDMRQFINTANQNGINNESLLKDTLNQAVVIQKNFKASSDDVSSIYKYIQLSDDRDAIAKYNKTMIALNQSQTQISQSILDQTIKSNSDVTDVMAAAGLSSDAMSNYNSTSTVLNQNLSKKYGSNYASSMMSEMNDLIKGMNTTEGLQKIATSTGGNYSEFINAFQKGDATTMMQLLLNGAQKYSSGNQSTIGKLLTEQYTGTNQSIAAAVNQKGTLNSEDINKINSTTANASSMSNTSENSYLTSNTAISGVASIVNTLSTNIEKWFGGSGMLRWENVGTAAAIAYLGSDLLKGGSSLINFFKEGGGGIGKLFTRFFGKGSTIAEAASSASTELTTLNAGGGAAGGALGKLAGGLVATGGGVLLGVTASKLLMDAIKGKEESSENTAKTNAANALVGTSLEGNSSASSINGLADIHGSENNNVFTDWGSGILNIGEGIGAKLSQAFGSVHDMNQHEFSLFKRNMQMQGYSSDDEKKAFLAYSMLADSAGDLSSVDSSLSTSELKSMYESGSYGTEASLNNWVKYINKQNKAPYKTRNDRQTDITWKRYSEGQGGALSYFTPSKIRGKSFNTNFNYGMGGDENSWTSMIKSPWLKVTSMWGNRPNPFGGGNIENHGGMDIAAPANTPIGSAVSGTVNTAGWKGSFGNAVYIEGDNGLDYIYGHMVRQPVVKAGQHVDAGQLIGNVGNTGRSTGNHLHFQVGSGWTKAESRDPVGYLTNGVLFPGSGNTSGVSSGSTSASSDNGQQTIGNPGSLISGPAQSSRRLLPGMGGPAGEVPLPKNNSVNSNEAVVKSINKIYDFLQGVQSEQSAQRKIINAIAESQR